MILYAELPVARQHSGGISRLPFTGSMKLWEPYRLVPPLEMTGRTGDTKANPVTPCPPPHSGVGGTAYTVSQIKGKRLNGQAMRQLWLTCTSSAGCAQWKGAAPAAYIIIVQRAPPQPAARRAVKHENPPAKGRSILSTFPFCGPFGPAPLWCLRHHLPPSFAGGTMDAQQCAT
mgnify:CR=1 FL=1